MVQDKHIVVTGGTGALGRAVVGRLLKGGAICHVPVFDTRELEAFPHNGHPNLDLPEGVDLSSETEVEAFYGQLPGLWASIHVAGGFDMAPVAETGQADFQRLMSMNALTCFLCCREAVKTIRRSAGDAGGRIVNVAAQPALEPRTGAGKIAYTASKAAVAAITQALAQEVAAEGIAVNAVAPSTIDTPANRQAMPKANHAAWPKPDEIAEVIVSLIALDSGVARGAIIPVYGRS